MRWDCQGCTLCCRLFSLGPVDPAIVQGLDAHGVREAWPAAADGFVHQRPEGLFLDHVDGSCVFLRGDGACAVHALYGPDAKPAFCRTFPLTRVATAQGTTHALRDDCGGTWQSQDTGTPLAEHVASLPPDAPVLVFGDRPVEVLPGIGLSGEDWLTLEPRLVSVVQSDAGAWENLVAVRDALLAALRRPAPEPAPGSSLAAGEALRQGLAGALGASLDPEATDYPSRFLRSVHQGVAQAELGQEPAPLDPEARRWWAGVLRQHLAGKAFVAWGGACWGLGGLAFGLALARARAPDGRLASVAPWHALWSRFTRQAGARALLHQHRQVLWELVLRR